MLTGLVHTAIALHAVATGFFLAYLFRYRPEVGKLARRSLWVALGIQGIATLGYLAEGAPPDAPVWHSVLFISAFAVDLVYLLLSLRFELTLLGSFVVPVTTALLLAILFAGTTRAPRAGPEILGLITRVHIGASILGFLAFTVSFVGSLAYVAQDFGLRTKRRSKLLSKLPSLSRLERFTHRALLVGFPIYTIGILLGTVWMARVDELVLAPQVLFSIGSWLVFGLLLQMHHTSGWRGSRAAILNMVGYLLVLLAVLIYALRGSGG